MVIRSKASCEERIVQLMLSRRVEAKPEWLQSLQGAYISDFDGLLALVLAPRYDTTFAPSLRVFAQQIAWLRNVDPGCENGRAVKVKVHHEQLQY